MRPRSLTIVLLVALAATSGSQATSTSDLFVYLAATDASVMIEPSGSTISCGVGACRFAFPEGTTVRLTAIPRRSASTFVGWSSGCARAVPTCTLTLAAITTVRASFSPVRLWFASSPGGAIKASPAGRTCGVGCADYPYGSIVTLSARPASTFSFAGWGEACESIGTSACRISLRDSRSVTAKFRSSATGIGTVPATPVVTFVVSVAGAGRVSGMSGTRLSCRSGCRFGAKRGSLVALTAIPSSTSTRFTGWGGVCSGGSATCIFVNDRDAGGVAPRVTASFAPA